MVHDTDVPGIDTELRYHLVGHELRGSVHRRSLGHGSADHAGEAERGAITELGKVHGGEVVHGHDTGGAATRGDDEVGPVDHGDGPHEPFDGRTAQMRPRPMQGAGGHGPLAHENTGWHEVGKPMAPAPGDGERVDLELGDRGESPQGTLTETTHARSRAEQRRGVDGHPETLTCGSRFLRHRSSLAHRAPGVWARTVSLAP